ncbi:MAG: M20/M25/M40 family metallo-hydrolase [Fervidicoccaceae archaeon]
MGFKEKNFFEIIDSYVKSNWDYLVEEARKLIRMPSISATGEGIEETAEYLRDWIRERLGGEATLLRYGGHPIVYGRVRGRSEKKAIVYNMYDVQPPDPLDLWEVPPFEARIVDGKIVARGSYNSKGALMGSLLGLEALVKTAGELPFTTYIVLEGEEELGSRSMPKFVDDKKAELEGSLVTYFAFPSESVPGKPWIILGNRGLVYIEVKAKTSKYDVHSSYSRGFYNPVAILSKIISHMIDPFEGPRLPWLEEKAIGPTEEDLSYLNDIKESSPMEEIMNSYGIFRPRISGDDWYVATHFKPTVNVDGIIAGYTGSGTKTIIPSEATMKLDFRLVPGIEPDDVVKGFDELLKRLGLKDMVEYRVLNSYTWGKTDPKSPAVKVARETYRELGLNSYIIPILPGSAPSYLFTRVLKTAMIDTAPGSGARAHAPNEYITVDTVPRTAQYTALFMENLARTAE